MKSEWQKTTLGAICNTQGGAIQTGPFGSQLHTSDYKEIGIPVVMPTNIGDGGIATDAIARISQEDVERLQQHKLQIDDIVFSRRGDVTKNALIRPHEVGWLCGTGCLKVRLGKQSLANAKFISYYLRLPAAKDWLIRHAVGATMPNLNTAILSAIPITLPPLTAQKEIAAALGALDDRITLLRETNATLEAIAQALFKSWFVDFDPVRAKMAGHPPEGMDAATAALFPDTLEESELGLVPKGWMVMPIGEAVETVGGATPDTKNAAFWNPSLHSWTSPKDLSGASVPVLLHTERRISNLGLKRISSGLLPIGTLLMSSRAPIGYLAITQIPVAINQGYIGLLPGGKLSPLFMLFWCRHNMDAIRGRANGSTFMEISKKAFRPIPALVPTPELLERFDNVAGALFARLIENEHQATSLAEIRDTSLPRLISGQLRLPDAEQTTEYQ
ncbi:restriction endonuclease subunit S [Brachymonas sp.]|uniref:restriction endonuclease subunit S n=1 Tax=Brachymonas sp. TaxID=1936292 RepID=UPI0035AD7CC3